MLLGEDVLDPLLRELPLWLEELVEIELLLVDSELSEDLLLLLVEIELRELALWLEVEDADRDDPDEADGELLDSLDALAEELLDDEALLDEDSSTSPS